MVKICHEQIRIPSKNVNNGEISSIRPSKRSRDDMKGRNNENEELQEDVQESEVVSEEDNMFGKAASGNQNERDGIVVKVEAAFMRSCLRAIMNNLDLFWKRSEEYPMECLADGKSIFFHVQVHMNYMISALCLNVDFFLFYSTLWYGMSMYCQSIRNPCLQRCCRASR